MSAVPAALPGAVRRHLGTLRECVRSPGDVWLVARMSAWAVWLPLLKYLMPLPRLVRLAAAPPRRAARRREQERKVVTLSRWIYAPVTRHDRGCLQRSLLAYRFLGEANASPRLLVGVRKDEGKVLAHAWVSVDGEPLAESPDWVGGFTTMLAFGADGRPQPAE
jgi:hypothetical protein